jgi:ribosomal protein S18 acetylase RimI-like enzyme
MVEDLIIREYNPSDEKKWLQCRLISFHDSAYYDDVYTKKPVFSNLSLELVAELNGQIVGILDLEKDNIDSNICYCKSGIGAMIWTIAVLPDYRRYKIASKLVLEAMDWSKNNDVNFIEAWTRDDKWVLDWYKSLDFNRFHSYWHIYFKNNNDKPLFESNDKDIIPQSIFAHSNKNPKTLDQNKIDRFYKCSGYKLEIAK